MSASESGTPKSPGRLATAGEERIHDNGGELRAAMLPHLLERFLEVEGTLVRALDGHRVPRVRKPDDRGKERYVLAGEPLGIARAVPALVVVAENGDALSQAELGDDARSFARVALHELVLVLGELAGLD